VTVRGSASPVRVTRGNLFPRRSCTGAMMAIAMPLLVGTSKAAPPRAPEIDAAVLARCKAQDPMAFRAFVVRYERAVFALLSRLLGRGPHVEDLAQETFLRAYRAFPAFEIDVAARPSTWLLTIATRLAFDARKRKVVPPEAVPRDDAPASPEATMSRVELGRAIERAAAELSDDHRAVFVLAEHHDLSLADIAVALGVPENTVKTRLFRARQQMRARLAGVLEEDHG
jgi:RNA polymerase sigma-70 factor (ECF subfamily)